MIIRRAFYRETSLAILAVATVLLILFAFLGLTQLLGRAAAGKEARDIVLVLLGLELVSRLSLLLPLAVYLGTVLTLSRWYRDNEMTVLAACGIGLSSMLRAVLHLAIVGGLVVGALSLYLSPWARATAEQVKKESEDRMELSGVVPGGFTELRGADRILYAERVDERGALQGVFASDRGSPRPNILSAARALQQSGPAGERLLVLQDGSVYEGVAGEEDYRLLEFSEYTVRLEPPQPRWSPMRPEGVPTQALLRSRGTRELAELHARLAKPLSVVVLAVFALVLAHTDVRHGRAGNLLAAVLVYFLYSNLLGVGEALVKDGRLPSALGLWWVHALFVATALYLFARRAANRPLLGLPRLGTPWRS